MSPFTIEPIGIVSSPFKEKFGIPRQPQLCAVESTIWLSGKANVLDTIRGLEMHSHIWVLFQFHQNSEKGWQPLVRPPRLDGNQKLGVFATRSTFRPNQLGMSAVKLLAAGQEAGNVWIKVEGLDLVDGTPIVDIKPYVPYSDCLLDAQSEFAQIAQTSELNITFAAQPLSVLEQYRRTLPNLKTTIEQVLKQDPRPAYKKHKADDKIYGIRLYDFNIRWQIEESRCEVLTIELQS